MADPEMESVSEAYARIAVFAAKSSRTIGDLAQWWEDESGHREQYGAAHGCKERDLIVAACRSTYTNLAVTAVRSARTVGGLIAWWKKEEANRATFRIRKVNKEYDLIVAACAERKSEILSQRKAA